MHIIYTENEMILSKKEYESWREIQDEYETYKASFGPWETDEVVQYLAEEYLKLCPEAHIQVKEFLNTNVQIWTLKFNE